MRLTGMKAYKTISDPDDLRLFRPELNMKRLSNSMHRLSCPGYDFDKKELIECIAELVRVGACKTSYFVFCYCSRAMESMQRVVLRAILYQTRIGFLKVRGTHFTFDRP